MSKYKVKSRRLPVSRPALQWWTPSARTGETAAIVTPWGLATLWRYPEGNRPNGGMRFVFEGGQHYRWYTPCPTRAGLVRMACREIRKIVGEKK